LRGGERLGGVKVFLVGGDPVGGDVPLRFVKAELAAANHAMQMIFKLIFHVGVPGGAGVRLGPQVAYIV
jgi:hypothetical protein